MKIHPGIRIAVVDPSGAFRGVFSSVFRNLKVVNFKTLKTITKAYKEARAPAFGLVFVRNKHL